MKHSISENRYKENKTNNKYLLCSTRPAFKKINSVITTRIRVAIKRTKTLPRNIIYLILNMISLLDINIPL
jgi:hypothetical protein